MPLTIGDPAPDFELPDQNGQLVSLKDLRGKRVILYFYPKDDTPGCTKEACGFRDRFTEFGDRNTVILGVSLDDASKHQKFIKKYDLPFSLLTDADTAVATAYGSYGLKKFMGREYMGVMRHTFVIGPDGTLEQVFLKVKPEPHAEEILACLD